MMAKRRKKRTFTDEFRAEVVALCQAPGASIASVSRDMDLTASSVRMWVKQAEADAKGPGKGALTTDERDELQELRKEIKRLKKEREILKQAAAFFAKEGSS